MRGEKPVAKETKPKTSPLGQLRTSEGSAAGGSRTQEEMQMGFPFLSYWYTSILMQWELAGEIQGLLVMEKLWLA